jgi:hypothetical protein
LLCHPIVHCTAATIAYCNSASTIAVSHCTAISLLLLITAVAVHHDHNTAHRDCATITPSIAPQLLSPIVMPLPSLSPIAAAAVHGHCHHNCTAVPSSIALPPLSPIAIVLPLTPSPIVTPAVTHRHHHHPSQLRHHPTIHCPVAAIVYCNHFSAIAYRCRHCPLLLRRRT